MDDAYQAYRSAVVSPTLRSIWSAVYRERLWERAVPPWTMSTADDVAFVFDRLKPQPTSRIVDLGCGSGCLGRHVVDAFGSEVAGIDASPLAVRFAQESSQGRYSGKVTFQTLDIAATGFADNEFDGAASLDVLLFANDKEGVLREIRRILKPGARFAGTTFELSATSPALGAAAFEDYPGAFKAAGLVVEIYEEAPGWKELPACSPPSWRARPISPASSIPNRTSGCAAGPRRGCRSWMRRDASGSASANQIEPRAVRSRVGPTGREDPDRDDKARSTSAARQEPDDPPLRCCRAAPDGKENIMHRFTVALALVLATAACEYKTERTVQSPPPAAVTTTAPASSTTYVTPTGNTTTVTTPAAGTTVYTR